MNNVCLAGNLTKDVELRSTQSGKQVANFSIAINEGKDKTEFVNCIAWEKTGELINQYCKKGDRLSCVGRLQTRKWDKDGETRYTTEVVVTQFDFPPKGNSDSHPNDYQQQAVSGGFEDDLDQDIPF